MLGRSIATAPVYRPTGASVDCEADPCGLSTCLPSFSTSRTLTAVHLSARTRSCPLLWFYPPARTMSHVVSVRVDSACLRLCIVVFLVLLLCEGVHLLDVAPDFLTRRAGNLRYTRAVTNQANRTAVAARQRPGYETSGIFLYPAPDRGSIPRPAHMVYAFA